MRDWTLLLGGLTVWALHFFAIYAAASIFPGTDIARWLTIAVTIPALGANAALIWVAAHRRRTADGGVESWAADVGFVGAALSIVAVIWQVLPAIMA